MAKVNLSQAAKLAGKNRTTIWRHINSGKLSIERDREGLPQVDTSELIRVYGEIRTTATAATQEKQQQATPSNEDLLIAIKALKDEQSDMKQQIVNLTNRLMHTPEPTTQLPTPENDPEWPAEIKTMADIAKRNEIKKKYD